MCFNKIFSCFLKIGMPYRILGGTKFYERAEIKDCVAYLRLINQEKDDLAFERIVNNPKRSIGDSTLKNIHEFAKENSLNLERASIKMLELLTRRKPPKLLEFLVKEQVASLLIKAHWL